MDKPKYGTPEYDKYVADERQRLEEIHGTVYDTSEVQSEFNIEGFMAPVCYGTRRSNGEKVYLTFQHSPRFYWE